MDPNEAGAFALSWAKLRDSEKTMVVLLCVMALFGFMYFYDRNSLIQSLQAQVTDAHKENKDLKKALKTKDCVVVVVTTKLINFAENSTKHSDSSRASFEKSIKERNGK